VNNDEEQKQNARALPTTEKKKDGNNKQSVYSPGGKELAKHEQKKKVFTLAEDPIAASTGL
jgi:hypothetical protein